MVRFLISAAFRGGEVSTRGWHLFETQRFLEENTVIAGRNLLKFNKIYV